MRAPQHITCTTSLVYDLCNCVGSRKYGQIPREKHYCSLMSNGLMSKINQNLTKSHNLTFLEISDVVGIIVVLF